MGGPLKLPLRGTREAGLSNMLSAPVCLQNAVLIQVQKVSRIFQNPCCPGKGHQCPEGKQFTTLIYPRSRATQQHPPLHKAKRIS